MFRRIRKNLLLGCFQATSILTLHAKCYTDTNDDIHTTQSNRHFNNVTILSGTACPQLSQSVCDHLNIELGKLDVTRFSDGEISIEIKESIRGKDIFIIQTCAAPVNDNILAARRSGANTVTVIIPYFGYKHNRRGLPISTTYHSRFLWSASADFARMLQVMGADKVISVDLQKSGEGQESCFFNFPAESVSSTDAFVEYIDKSLNMKSSVPVVFVSSGSENVKKATKFESLLRAVRPDLSINTCVLLNNDIVYYKGDGTINSDVLGGNIIGSDVIIVDDFVDIASKLSVLCRRLKRSGAKRVFVCASHGLFSSNSMKMIDLSPVEQVIVTDTIPLPENHSKKIKQVSVVPLIARILESEAVTKMAIWDNDKANSENDPDEEQEEDDNEEFQVE